MTAAAVQPNHSLTPIEAIKQSINISDALERYAGAKMSGRAARNRMQICCPFHDDRSPSMTVYLDTNKCRCWAGDCRAHGHVNDVIDVVMMSQGISRKEAVHTLLTDYGLSTGEGAKEAVKEARRLAAFDTECREALKVIHGMMDGIYISQRKAFEAVKTHEQMGRAWDKKGDMIARMYEMNNKLLLLEWALTDGDRGQKQSALEEVKALAEEGDTE